MGKVRQKGEKQTNPGWMSRALTVGATGSRSPKSQISQNSPTEDGVMRSSSFYSHSPWIDISLQDGNSSAFWGSTREMQQAPTIPERARRQRRPETGVLWGKAGCMLEIVCRRCGPRAIKTGCHQGNSDVSPLYLG